MKGASASVGALFYSMNLNIAGLGPTIPADLGSKADPRADAQRVPVIGQLGLVDINVATSRALNKAS
jgi:hypothetical protein